MKTCTVEGCNRKHASKGYCSMHYKRWRSHGHTDSTRAEPNLQEGCSLEECDSSFWARGFCRTHYHRLVRYGDPLGGPADLPDEEKLAVRIRQQAQRYGLKYEALLEMYKKCNYSCMACGQTTSLVVDHDHSCCSHANRKCGKCVRGLLCVSCNNMAGYIEANPDRAQQVVTYLG